MKFGENLQKLRKEKKISQEQLAEQLGVTRQSVSKWESNASYPEMDKLITLCKIFNCDLDVLVNKDINDELNKKDASNTIKTVFKKVMIYIEKTVRLFEKKSFKEICKLLAQIILIIIIILLFNIPFQLIEGTITNSFYNYNNYISTFLSNLCSFILNSIYIVFAITTFLYIFKVKFLDDYQYNDIEIEEKENLGISENKKNSQKLIRKKIHENTLVDILVWLITIFIKFCLLLFLIPLIITTIMLIICLVILIIIIFKGVILLGPIICLVSLGSIFVLFIELILNFIFNLKINKKRTVITIISSLIVGSIGMGLSIWYFLNLNIIDDYSKEYKRAIYEETIPMSQDLKFHNIYSDIEYIKDDNLNDKVLVQVEYNKNYYKDLALRIENNGYILNYKSSNSFSGSKIVNIIISDLKQHKLYTYYGYNDIKYTIKTSQENINRIRTNQQNWNDYEEENDF